MRKRFVAVGVTVAVVLTAVLGWRHLVTSRAQGGPIVLISIDTLRADHLPVYGYTKVRTPNIDALAAGGVLFERAYSHAPQTLPAHASILSGELPFGHGVRDNIGFTFKPGQWLLQSALRDRGWRTGGFVSSYVLRGATGMAQGFDTYDSELPAASAEASIAQVQRDGALTLNAARRWLASLSTDRFFLFFHVYEPHTPYTPPARFAEYALPYDGEIAYADEIVGGLLQTLHERRLYDKATIILLSDHGEGLGDHGELEHGVFIYEETIHVPLIVKLPGRGGGRRVTQPVQHIDLAPTLLDLTGSAARADLGGRSLRPLLEGSGRNIPETGIYAEALYARYHFGWSDLYGLTDARYGYIRAPREELYDLQTDPRQRQNIAAVRPQSALAMRGALDRMATAAPREAPARVSAEEREQFQALGYIGMDAGVAPAAPSDTLPDPKDKIAVLERYRRAVTLAGRFQLDEAIILLRQIVADEPNMADVWNQLGALELRAGRPAEAAAAYKRFVELKPREPAGLLGAASALLKLGRIADAQANGALAARLADAGDSRARVTARQLLAKIALARHDEEGARREAALAREADPTLPLPEFVEGVIRYDRGEFGAALPWFERALAVERTRTLQMPDLRYYLGDTLARLDRFDESERRFREALGLFPQDQRARAGLAMLYRATGRPAQADQAIAEMLRVGPTPDSYDTAVRLWSMFGEKQRAEQTRGEAVRRFGSRRPGR